MTGTQNLKEMGYVTRNTSCFSSQLRLRIIDIACVQNFTTLALAMPEI